MKSIGYYGCYAIQSTTTLMSLAYLCLFIKEPAKNKARNLAAELVPQTKLSFCENVSQLCRFFILDPLVKMTKTIFKLRPENRRFLLLLQIIVYFLYW